MPSPLKSPTSGTSPGLTEVVDLVDDAVALRADVPRAVAEDDEVGRAVAVDVARAAATSPGAPKPNVMSTAPSWCVFAYHTPLRNSTRSADAVAVDVADQRDVARNAEADDRVGRAVAVVVDEELRRSTDGRRASSARRPAAGAATKLTPDWFAASARERRGGRLLRIAGHARRSIRRNTGRARRSSRS